ncbi:MAG: hypothetical protein JKX85_08000 [Phycisphaeraceae bacterium]|nr:hypothetical protein [Phycisphaeraceae bacterium]
MDDEATAIEPAVTKGKKAIVKPTEREDLTFNFLRFVLTFSERVIRPLGFVWLVGYFLADIFSSLAGKTTVANFLVEWFTESPSGVSFTINLGLTIVAVLWAIKERRHRLKKVEILGNRISHLEAQRDPNRTTSGLLTNGQTHPVDRT